MSDTPLAVKATAQSTLPPEKATDGPAVRCPGLGVRFTIGPAVTRAARCRPYERRDGDPLYRPLKIFTLDPAQPRRDGAISILSVPYEALKPGPVGALFEVVDFDGIHTYLPVDLDDPKVLLGSGVEPSASRSNPEFHQQMVYAVASAVYAVFRTALGRHITWGFDARDGSEGQRLRLVPHARENRNAFFDKAAGEIQFGYFRARSDAAGLNMPGGMVFTCLSHDIVVHEVTHALLDGLRAHFEHPLNPDVLAFHEGFADVVAILQRFTYRSVVEAALRGSRGKLETASLLTDLARQFGHTTTSDKPLRTVIDPKDSEGRPLTYESSAEPHERGSVFASAIFAAFLTAFDRRTERYVRLATNGSGILPPGDLSPHLLSVLADEAGKLASQFLSVCIRAIDYCPPVDVTFGDYLRGLLTADRAVVPDDKWGYREAFIDAFGKRKIYPGDVDSLSEDALLWKPPRAKLGSIGRLSFARLRFAGDPSMPSSTRELFLQSCALGRFASDPANMARFGLAEPGDPRLKGDTVEPPCVQSIRTSRRVGPHGQLYLT